MVTPDETWQAELDRPKFFHRIDEKDGQLQRESYVYWTPEGAIELWRTPSPNPSLSWNSSGYYGGVETHSPTQRYEWASEPLEGCPWVRGGKCFPDGSSLAFDRFAHDFDSPDYIKSELKARHEYHFGGGSDD